MLTKTERIKKIETLEKVFGAAKGIYLTDIQKIKVDLMTKLRADFRSRQIKYIVVKNSLAKIAAERCGKRELIPYFQGPVGVAVSSIDSVAPAKIIRDFQKANKELLNVKVALVDGNIFSGEQTERIADIPSKEILLSQLLSCLKAPMANLCGALGAIFGKLCGTLEAVKNKKEAELKQSA